MENKERLRFYLGLVKSSLDDIKKYLQKIEMFLPIDYENYLELSELHKDKMQYLLDFQKFNQP